MDTVQLIGQPESVRALATSGRARDDDLLPAVDLVHDALLHVVDVLFGGDVDLDDGDAVGLEDVPHARHDAIVGLQALLHDVGRVVRAGLQALVHLRRGRRGGLEVVRGARDGVAAAVHQAVADDVRGHAEMQHGVGARLLGGKERGGLRGGAREPVQDPAVGAAVRL